MRQRKEDDSTSYYESIDSSLQDVSLHLERMNKLLAYVATKDVEDRDEKIVVLNSFGLSPSEIAPLVSATPNAVSIVISRNKSSNKKGRS